MSDRKAELERKKAKLAELRQEKLRREQGRLTHDGTLIVANFAKVDPDAILKEVGLHDYSPVSSTASTPLRQPSVSPLAAGDLQRVPSTTKRSATPVRLGVSKVSQVSIAPPDNVMYEKETQTSLQSVAKNGDPSTWDADALNDETQRTEEDESGELASTFPNIAAKRRIVDARAGAGESHAAAPNDGDADADQSGEAADGICQRELSEQERIELMRSERFRSFIERETRIVERMLCENEEVDVFIDYARTRSEGGSDAAASTEVLTAAFDFYNEPLCRGRTVTSLDWSTVHNDLLLASYASQSFGEAESASCVIWNLRFRRCAPEYVLTCPSGILSACFARTVPHLVAAGTYSGSVCVWDLRAARRSPVQRTPIGGAQGHTHPVFNVRVANTAGGSAQQVVSLSTDGRMCTWSLDMLSAPLEVLELGWQKGARTVSATAFSLLVDGDVSSGFLVGSEDGAVYAGGGVGRPSLHAAYEGHFGPVTALDCNQLLMSQAAGTALNNLHTPLGSQLFVSSGFDSTVRLWSVQDSPSASGHKPLFTIDHAGGYVTDVQWSPTHPAAFATLDSCGRVELWSLTRDCELPLASAGGQRPPPAEAHAAPMGGLNLFAMSKLRWHQEGRFVAAGDACGHLTLYQVGNEIVSPKGDEFSRLTRVLSDMRTESAGAPPSARGRDESGAAHAGSGAT